MEFVKLSEYFDLFGEVGRGSFGTVFRARTRLQACAAAAGHKDDAFPFLYPDYVHAHHDVALKRITLSCGISIKREVDALHAVQGCSNVIELLACVGNNDSVSGEKKRLGCVCVFVINFAKILPTQWEMSDRHFLIKWCYLIVNHIELRSILRSKK